MRRISNHGQPVEKKTESHRRFKTDGIARIRSSSMIFRFYVGFTAVYKARNGPKGKRQASGILFQMLATSAQKSRAINVSWVP